MRENEDEAKGEQEEFASLSDYELLISGGSITLMGLGKCVVSGARYALKTMYNLVLETSPKVVSEPLPQPPRAFCGREMYAALITLKHEQVHGSGFVFVTIPKVVAKRLLEEAGVVKHATEGELVDSCGELCNLIAGAFKAEINDLGLGLIKISPPKLFPNGADEIISDIGGGIESKYVLNVYHRGNFLLTIEVAFKSGHG